MDMGCLYSLTSPSGKSYIGISLKTAQARFAKHTEHALGKRQNGVLYSALRKYGPERFSVQTLVIANDWKYLCDLEIKAISAFGTRYPFGYNMTDGGEGIVGPKDAEFSAKVSIAQKKRFEKPEEMAKAKIALLKGREANRLKCEARRINGKARWQIAKHDAMARIGSKECNAKISRATKRAMARPEVTDKIKWRAKERAASDTWRAKISASKTGKSIGPASELRKSRIADARRREWQDPIIRSRRLEAFAIARAARRSRI